MQEPKFKLGQIVQRYEVRKVPSKQITCPICRGNYKVYFSNPYEVDPDNYDCLVGEYLICGCCEKGKIPVSYKEEKILKEEKFIIDRIYITIDNKGTYYSYSIISTPELNNGDPGFISTVVEEEVLILSKEVNNDER